MNLRSTKYVRAALALAAIACQVLPARGVDCPDGYCAPRWLPHEGAIEGERAAAAATPRAAVVRVRNEQRDGTADLGSGVATILEDGSTAIVTCAHLFRQGVGRVSVEPQGSEALRARVLGIDRQYDLAALALVDDASLPAAKVAARYSPAGAVARACGFGSSGRYREQPGHVLGYLRAGAMPTAQTMLVEGAARSGDSGGPIFDERGEIAAVLWGTDGARSYGTCCLRLRQFLGRLAPPNVPAAPPRESPPQVEPPVDDELPRMLPDKGQRDNTPTRSIPSPPLGGPVGRAAGTWASGKLVALLVGVGVPGWAAAIGVWLVMRRGRRRLEKLRGRTNAAKPDAPRLHDDYARELVEVFRHSGRSPVQDATLGREYDEELRRAAASSDANLARWAESLRRRVMGRFHRIHGESPAPAEPVASGA